MTGRIGLQATRAVGFPGILDDDVSTRQRILVPALAGGLLGAGFIGVDLALAPYNGLGTLPHPPFPASVVASVTAAIGEELIFRLLLVGGGCWLLTGLVDRGPAREGVFRAVALFAAVAFTAAHLPGILYIVGHGDPAAATLHPVLLVELLVMNGALSLAAAELLRRSGLLAAIGIHF
ncbi:MAG: CPBP family glutamic-type intramembrane protease [Candidatus Longimicrobiales bacterium M2_2A_002]